MYQRFQVFLCEISVALFVGKVIAVVLLIEQVLLLQLFRLGLHLLSEYVEQRLELADNFDLVVPVREELGDPDAVVHIVQSSVLV